MDSTKHKHTSTDGTMVKKWNPTITYYVVTKDHIATCTVLLSLKGEGPGKVIQSLLCKYLAWVV